MIFSISIGSSGVGKESYSLHIPLVLSSGKNITLEDQSYIGEIDGLTVILEKHHHLYSLKFSKFDSVSQAQKYLTKVLASLRWISLKYKVGVKLPQEVKNLTLFDKPISPAKEGNMLDIVRDVGWSALDGSYDVDKMAIIPEHKRLTRFETGQVSLTLSYSPNTFIRDLQQCLEFKSLEKITEQKKLCLAIELYAAHPFEITSSGKFIKLVTVLESLLPDADITGEALVFLNEAKSEMKKKRNAIKAAGGDIDSIDHLRNRLRELSKKAIGDSIELYVSALFEEFPDLGDSEKIIPKLKVVYNIRSRLLHDGVFDEDSLLVNISLLNDLIPKILTNLFLKYANESPNEIELRKE